MCFSTSAIINGAIRISVLVVHHLEDPYFNWIIDIKSFMWYSGSRNFMIA